MFYNYSFNRLCECNIKVPEQSRLQPSSSIGAIIGHCAHVAQNYFGRI